MNQLTFSDIEYSKREEFLDSMEEMIHGHTG